MPEQLLQQEVDILDTLAMSTSKDFDSVLFSIVYNRQTIMDSFDHLKALGYILEPREWRYQITDAGRAALAYATYDVDIDPLTMVYAGLGAS